jgi:hypothetical protein
VRKFSFSKLRTRHLVRAALVGLVIFFASAVVFYWQTGRQADQIIIERVENQELSMARSSALSLSEFLKARKKELILFSELETVQASREKEGMMILVTLAKELKKEEAPVGNIIRINKEGVTVWGINVALGEQDEAAIGVDLSSRPCFVWARDEAEEGEVFIDEPMVAQGGSLKGERIVSLTTPVFYQGNFAGIMVVNFLVEELAKKYIEPLSLSPKTHYTILSKEGTVIASTFKELVGKNIRQIQEEKSWPEDSRVLVEGAIRGEEGAAFHSFVNLLTGETSKAVSAYSPVRINGNSLWSAWVSVPYGEIEELVTPFRQNQILTLISVLSGTLLLAAILILGIKVGQKDGFLDGYYQAKSERARNQKT